VQLPQNLFGDTKKKNVKAKTFHYDKEKREEKDQEQIFSSI
jgi:hypothetical protein